MLRGTNAPFPRDTFTCPTKMLMLPISVYTFPTPRLIGFAESVALAPTLALVPLGAALLSVAVLRSTVVVAVGVADVLGGSCRRKKRPVELAVLE
jgi:hypothetical protein